MDRSRDPREGAAAWPQAGGQAEGAVTGGRLGSAEESAIPCSGPPHLWAQTEPSSLP